MAGISHCSLVPDVTAPLRVASKSVSNVQARFLRFFLAGPPDRALWLRAGRRLGPVSQPFTYRDDASHALVYRVAAGDGLTMPGEAVDRIRISLPELRDLWRYWREPLVSLNTAGETVARSRFAKRNRVASFRQTEAERAELAAYATRTGLPLGVILAELVADFLAAHPQPSKTAVAEYSKGRT